MDTVRDKEKRIWHVGCGGEVIRGVCVKCGKKRKSLVSRLLGDGPLIIREKDIKTAERLEYRRRIRRGKDIWKD